MFIIQRFPMIHRINLNEHYPPSPLPPLSPSSPSPLLSVSIYHSLRAKPASAGPVAPSAAEQVADRHRIAQHQGLGAGVAVPDAGVRDVVEHEPEARAVVEAIGDLDAGAELRDRAQVLAPAPGVAADGEAGAHHPPLPLAAEEDVDQDAAIAIDRLVRGRHDAEEGLEDPRLEARSVLQGEGAGPIVVEDHIEHAGLDGQEVRILGAHGRRGNHREHGKGCERRPTAHVGKVPPGQKEGASYGKRPGAQDTRPAVSQFQLVGDGWVSRTSAYDPKRTFGKTSQKRSLLNGNDPFGRRVELDVRWNIGGATGLKL